MNKAVAVRRSGGEAMALLLCPECRQYVDAVYRVSGFAGMRCQGCVDALAKELREVSREEEIDRFYHEGRGI